MRKVKHLKHILQTTQHNTTRQNQRRTPHYTALLFGQYCVLPQNKVENIVQGIMASRVTIQEPNSTTNFLKHSFEDESGESCLEDNVCAE